MLDTWDIYAQKTEMLVSFVHIIVLESLGRHVAGGDCGADDPQQVHV